MTMDISPAEIMLCGFIAVIALLAAGCVMSYLARRLTQRSRTANAEENNL